MKYHQIKIKHHDELFPFVAGRVFHVTPSVNMQTIKAVGALVPNVELAQKSKFGDTSNGFFRLRGCVSFFDYRLFGSKKWKEFAFKCLPTKILNKSSSITVLFLGENQYSQLVSWSNWKEEEAWSTCVVPHVEAGYKGEVSLSYITEELTVECDYN